MLLKLYDDDPYNNKKVLAKFKNEKMNKYKYTYIHINIFAVLYKIYLLFTYFNVNSEWKDSHTPDKSFKPLQ